MKEDITCTCEAWHVKQYLKKHGFPKVLTFNMYHSCILYDTCYITHNELHRNRTYKFGDDSDIPQGMNNIILRGRIIPKYDLLTIYSSRYEVNVDHYNLLTEFIDKRCDIDRNNLKIFITHAMVDDIEALPMYNDIPFYKYDYITRHSKTNILLHTVDPIVKRFIKKCSNE